MHGRRLNWHPQVHRAYDEELFYAMLRFVQPRTAAQTLQTILREAGIHYFCAYVITGYYDSLVRFWTTPQSRQRFLKALARHKNDVHAVKEFQASELFYSWDDSDILSREDLLGVNAANVQVADVAGDLQDKINSVALSPGGPNIGIVDELLSQRLLIVKPAEQETSLKVIVVLQPTALFVDDPQVSFRLLERLRSIPELSRLSLYGGTGDLGRYVVRFTIGAFTGLPAVMDQIEDAVGALPLRTMTLPLAQLIGEESDNINNTHRLAAGEHRLADSLDVPLDKLERMSARSRERAMALLTFANSELGRPEPWKTGLRAIRSAVAENPLTLRENLSFILDFEYYFREYARSRFKRQYDDNWQRIVMQKFSRLFKNMPVGLLDDYDKWPLGVLHAALIEAASQDLFLKATLSAELGEDWAQTSRGMLNLRNPFAHGRLIRNIKKLNDLEGEWGDQLQQALIGMAMFSKLFVYVEEEDEGR